MEAGWQTRVIKGSHPDGEAGPATGAFGRRLRPPRPPLPLLHRPARPGGPLPPRRGETERRAPPSPGPRRARRPGQPPPGRCVTLRRRWPLRCACLAPRHPGGRAGCEEAVRCGCGSGAPGGEGPRRPGPGPRRRGRGPGMHFRARGEGAGVLAALLFAAGGPAAHAGPCPHATRLRCGRAVCLSRQPSPSCGGTQSACRMPSALGVQANDQQPRHYSTAAAGNTHTRPCPAAPSLRGTLLRQDPPTSCPPTAWSASASACRRTAPYKSEAISWHSRPATPFPRTLAPTTTSCGA